MRRTWRGGEAPSLQGPVAHENRIAAKTYAEGTLVGRQMKGPDERLHYQVSKLVTAAGNSKMG